jgi:hypothetical protein
LTGGELFPLPMQERVFLRIFNWLIRFRKIKKAGEGCPFPAFIYLSPTAFSL